MDDEIEAAEGMSIAGIFSARGEAGFRQIEAAALGRVADEIAAGKAAVVASGFSTNASTVCTPSKVSSPCRI